MIDTERLVIRAIAFMQSQSRPVAGSMPVPKGTREERANTQIFWELVQCVHDARTLVVRLPTDGFQRDMAEGWQAIIGSMSSATAGMLDQDEALYGYISDVCRSIPLEQAAA